jgi:hypothetical protein
MVRARRPSKARLRALITEATVDAYGDAEQRTSFATTIEEHVEMPFTVQILGADVMVTAVVQNKAGELVAVCESGRSSARISLIDLPIPEVVPDGWAWIEAYREWARGLA